VYVKKRGSGALDHNLAAAKVAFDYRPEYGLHVRAKCFELRFNPVRWSRETFLVPSTSCDIFIVSQFMDIGKKSWDCVLIVEASRVMKSSAFEEPMRLLGSYIATPAATRPSNWASDQRFACVGMGSRKTHQTKMPEPGRRIPE
jgi:hypothetical protein